MPHSKASDLDLRCLPMSHKYMGRLYFSEPEVYGSEPEILL